MSWRERLDDALDAHRAGAPTVPVAGPSGDHAELDVVQVGPIGARVRELRITHTTPRDVVAEATRLVREVHALGAPLTPVEVDRALGGAILRTVPHATRRWFEVRTTPTDTRVRRVRRDEHGDTQNVDFDLTREQLGDLLDTLDGSG